ncbi:MAG: phosphatidylglycerophosphatase A [Proteobacteria bacterium]|nr:phosphatidylglycerophosphatase A [Pseudomonadota bacterium]
MSTWFGAGLMPIASGTWGSAAALPFAYVLLVAGGPDAGPYWLGAAALVVFLIGIWSAGVYCRYAGVGDPGAIVIDEVAAQWLTLTVAPPRLLPFVLGFLLFRVFDVLKPWPASWADRSVKGGLGVMLDDLFAGIYAAIVLWGIERWLL